MVCWEGKRDFFKVLSVDFGIGLVIIVNEFYLVKIFERGLFNIVRRNM